MKLEEFLIVNGNVELFNFEFRSKFLIEFRSSFEFRVFLIEKITQKISNIAFIKAIYNHNLLLNIFI